MERERRTIIASEFEVREAEDGGGFVVKGHGTTFDDPYPVWDFEEVVDRDAVPDDIQSRDVFALWSHDMSIPLARTTNGSLKLSKDDVGLAVEFTMPEERRAEAEAIRTGLIDKMSIGFYVVRQRWEEREDDLPDLRTILEMELLEVSAVAIPANPNTDLSPRQREAIQEAREKCLGPRCKREERQEETEPVEVGRDMPDPRLARLEAAE